VGEDMNFRDLEELIPGLKEVRERKEAQQTANQAEKSTSATTQQEGLAGKNPPLLVNPAGNVPQVNQGGIR